MKTYNLMPDLMRQEDKLSSEVKLKLIVSKNYRILKVFGDSKEKESMVDRPCYEVLHGNDCPCSQKGEECLLEKVFSSGCEDEFIQHIHNFKDGQGPVVVNAQLLQGKPGDEDCVLLTLSDEKPPLLRPTYLHHSIPSYLR
ncbi:MAG: hypothetical protein ABW185_11385 [Sedimenticola sp.]